MIDDFELMNHMELEDLKHPFMYKIWFNWEPRKVEISNIENVGAINDLMNQPTNDNEYMYFVKPENYQKLGSIIDILTPKAKFECNGIRKCESELIQSS